VSGFFLVRVYFEVMGKRHKASIVFRKGKGEAGLPLMSINQPLKGKIEALQQSPKGPDMSSTSTP